MFKLFEFENGGNFDSGKICSGRELFAYEANVGGDDDEAEDIVIEKEVIFSILRFFREISRLLTFF